MTLISTTSDLAAFCDRQRAADFVTVDTEFLRDKTYWPQLCLVQVASASEAVAIDALAPGLDLAPLLDLMNGPVLKVFHAARQDLEIFFNLTGRIPGPLVDTQIMAMVCGFGDAASYETLAGKLANARLDKSSRFTDWASRPLTPRQLDYAIADVTHLREVYVKLNARIAETGRAAWIADELAELVDPSTYRVDPAEAWRRLKTRGGNRKFVGILKELAAWRERAAQARDIPRQRILRDEALLEIASHAPVTIDDLARVRGLGRPVAEGKLGGEMLACVTRGLAAAPAMTEDLGPRIELPQGLGPLTDLLKVLLKLRCEEHEVAQKLVASVADLELIAADDRASVRALEGWRRALYGEDALALKYGRLALTAEGSRIRVVPLRA